MRWLRRSIVGLGALALAVVAAGVGGIGAGSAGGARVSQRAAERDAARLLSQVVLPAGAVVSAAEPPGDSRYLSRPGQIPAASNVVDRHHWWTVPADETDVSNFVRAHQPPGTQMVTDGVGDGQFPFESLTFELRSGDRSLGTRWLVVEVIALTDGQTGMRADAEVQWIVPRPAAERIPRGARVLDVSERTPPHGTNVHVAVTSAATIRRLASLIDGLKVQQPAALDCSGRIDEPVVTFTFRSGPAGRVLARASQVIEPGATGGYCEPMTLIVNGRIRPPLLGGESVVRAAQRLLGVRLMPR